MVPSKWTRNEDDMIFERGGGGGGVFTLKRTNPNILCCLEMQFATYNQTIQFLQMHTIYLIDHVRVSLDHVQLISA
jgi:hypothetical protein